MSYEMYEVVKQYHFEILGFEPVKAEIWKTIKPNMNNPYMWKASHIHSGYAPNHGNSLELAEEELLYYIEHFDIKSAERDPFY
ncbi:hypothetical protein [Lonsdalea britannica]|uniref:hypothetical protein n=1 Tax=Lonsdalea britannica TaxID=1082704 RepID=UPI00111C51E7|nr:hypothetical protein [Lonsdalea britannica]